MTFERTQNKRSDHFLKRLQPGVTRATAWFYALAIILITLESAPSLARELAYAQSPHQPVGQEQSIFNLFDERAATSWCSTPAPGTQTHHLQVALKNSAPVTHIDIALSRMPNPPLHVEISNGNRSVSFTLSGASIHLKFDKQFSGQVFDFYFETSKSETELCIDELKMLNRGHNLMRLPDQTKRTYSTVTGAWFEGQPGTTEKKLIFAMDGTWSWVHKPFFGAEEKRMSGTYKIRGNILTLYTPGTRKTWSLPLTKERVVIDPDDFDAPDFDYDKLVLKGPKPSIFAGSYNNARFDALN